MLAYVYYRSTSLSVLMFIAIFGRIRNLVIYMW